MTKVKSISKALLSLWIVYNIFTMLVMPNIGSYFGRVTSRFITPYANTVGLNAGWNFYSPEPAQPMHLKYIIYFEDELGEEMKPPVEGYFPSENDDRNIPLITRKREWSLMRFMVLDAKRMRHLMGPWFCRHNPGASSVELEHVVAAIPFLDSAVARNAVTIEELSQTAKYLRVKIDCNEAGDEVEL